MSASLRVVLPPSKPSLNHDQEALSEIRFSNLLYSLMEKISRETFLAFLHHQERLKEDFITESFLPVAKVPEDSDLSALVEKIGEYVAGQLALFQYQNKIDTIKKGGCYCILKSEFNDIENAAVELKSLSPGLWKAQIMKISLDPEWNIPDFVENFNRYFILRDKKREIALAFIEGLQKRCWHFDKGVKLVPKPEYIDVTRKGLMQLYLCDDAQIKEKVLKELIDILNGDPLVENTAYGLVTLQKQILAQIRSEVSQDLNIKLQRLLITAYEATAESLLLHSTIKNLNGVTKGTKEESWTGAGELQALNVVEDEEIKFRAHYAIQCTQRMKTDEGVAIEWLGRTALIARSILRVVIAAWEQGGLYDAINDLYFDLRSAFHHVEWKKEWVTQLLMLKRLCRYWNGDEKRFSKIVDMMKELKSKETEENLLYGIITILEDTVLGSPCCGVKEECMKLLLQYKSLEVPLVQDRIEQAFIHFQESDNQKIKNTAMMVISLLGACQDTQHHRKAEGKDQTMLAAPMQAPIKTSESRAESATEIKRNVNFHERSPIPAEKRRESFVSKTYLEMSKSQKILCDGVCRSQISKNLITKETIYKNVIEFLIRRLAGINDDNVRGGHSLVTFLSSSTRHKVIPSLLKCLSSFSGEFCEPNIWGETPYHIAIQQKNLPMIRSINKELKIDINKQTYELRNTALHEAVQTQFFDGVAVLLEVGARPNVKNVYGETPLHLAVKADSFGITEALLINNADMSIIDNEGNTPLQAAIKRDFVMLVELFLKEELNRENKKDHFQGKEIQDKKPQKKENCLNTTPISYAASQKAETTLIFLIENTRGYLSPLECLEITRMISVDGVNIGCSDRFCSFHIEWMEENANYAQSFRFFSKWPQLKVDRDQKYYLQGAHSRKSLIFNEEKEMSRSEEGADPFGNTLITLYSLSEKSIRKLQKVILEHGKLINRANFLGVTPLHAAVVTRNYRAVQILINEGADLDAQEIKGFSPLHLAAYFRDDKMIKLLLDSGADPKCVNNYGDTPLLTYCGNLSERAPQSILTVIDASCIEIQESEEELTIQKFIERGADPESRDIWLNNALHHAARRGAPKIISCLVERYPRLFWQKNTLNLLPVSLSIDATRSIHLRHFLKPSLAKDVRSLNDQFIKETLNRETSGNLLVTSGQMDLLGNLLDEVPEAAAHQESTPLRLTPLHVAAKLGKEEVVGEYTKRSLTLDARDAFGNTPAHLAALKKKWKFLRLLIKSGADVHAKNRDGRNPLHLAATQDGERAHNAVEVLLEADQALAYEKDGFGDTPLHLACRHNRDSIAKVLSNQFPELVHAINDDENTPLHLACSVGNLDAVQDFYDKQASLEERNASGQTPLIIAAQQGHESIVTFLLEKNVDHRKQDDEGETALHKAVFNRYRKIVIILLKLDRDERFAPKDMELTKIIDVNKETPLHKIGRGNRKVNADPLVEVEILEELLNAGVDFNHENEHGESFLHFISYHGANHLLEYLQSYKCSKKKAQKVDFSVVDNKENTPLHKACEGNQLTTAMILANLGPFDNKNHAGLSPLLLAAKLGHTKIARFLWERGAQIRKTDKEDRTILHLILENAQLDSSMLAFLEKVVKACPDLLYTKDENKRTPLHVLAEKGHLEPIPLLLHNLPGDEEKNQKYVYKKNHANLTAIDIANDHAQNCAPELRPAYLKIAETLRTYKKHDLGKNISKEKKQRSLFH